MTSEPVFTSAEQSTLECLNDKMNIDPEYISRMSEDEFAVYKKFIVGTFGVYDNFMADFDYPAFMDWAKRVCAPDSDSDDFRMIKRKDAIPPNGREDPNSDQRRVASSSVV